MALRSHSDSLLLSQFVGFFLNVNQLNMNAIHLIVLDRGVGTLIVNWGSGSDSRVYDVVS